MTTARCRVLSFWFELWFEHAGAPGDASLGAHKGADEPDVIGAKKDDKGKQLANEQALYAGIDSLNTTAKRGQGAEGEGATGGGAGEVTAWSRPELVIAAPGGIAAVTPATAIVAAGSTLTIVAGQWFFRERRDGRDRLTSKIGDMVLAKPSRDSYTISRTSYRKQGF